MFRRQRPISVKFLSFSGTPICRFGFVEFRHNFKLGDVIQNSFCCAKLKLQTLPLKEDGYIYRFKQIRIHVWHKLIRMVGWLFLAYRPFETVFQSVLGRLPERRRKKREMIDERKMSEQSPPAPTASALGPCPSLAKISRTPRHALEVYPAASHHPSIPPPTPPPSNHQNS